MGEGFRHAVGRHCRSEGYEAWNKQWKVNMEKKQHAMTPPDDVREKVALEAVIRALKRCVLKSHEATAKAAIAAYVEAMKNNKRESGAGLSNHEIAEKLFEAACSTLWHDRDEEGQEYAVMKSDTLPKFIAILRRSHRTALLKGPGYD